MNKSFKTLDALVRELKRLAQRTLRAGPISANSIDSILRERNGRFPLGICGPENLDGILTEVTLPPTVYQKPVFHGTKTVSLWQGREPSYAVTPRLTPMRKVRLYQFSDMCIRGEEGVVYDPGTRVAVEETALCWFAPANQHLCFYSPRFPKPTRLQGRTLSLLTRGGTCFYHFLIEGLQKLALAKPWLDSMDHILVNGRNCRDRFHPAWLQRAGLPLERLVYCDGFSHFQCETLVFCPSIMAEQQPTAWNVGAMREVFHSTNSHPPGRTAVIISRADANERRITALESELLKAVPALQALQLSRISPEEQINLFANAAVVIGAHGSGLSNLFWCGQDTIVIELFEKSDWAFMYSRISSVVGLQHHCVFLTNDVPKDVAAVRDILQPVGL